MWRDDRGGPVGRSDTEGVDIDTYLLRRQTSLNLLVSFSDVISAPGSLFSAQCSGLGAGR